MRKIFTDFPICGTFELSADDAHHVVVVLRHTVGDTLNVTDCTGATYECFITRMEGHSAYLTPARKISDGPSSNGRVILAAGLLKGDKFDWVVQKATELGAGRIVPVQMEHCVVKLDDKRRQARLERWQRLALEAAKQCGRDDVPDVAPVMSFTELVDAYADTRFVIPYEQETAPLSEPATTCVPATSSSPSVPKGAMPKKKSPMPRSVCRGAARSLGPRILRAETASLAALSIIMYERGFK